jgi:hypothetical protein
MSKANREEVVYWGDDDLSQALGDGGSTHLAYIEGNAHCTEEEFAELNDAITFVVPVITQARDYESKELWQKWFGHSDVENSDADVRSRIQEALEKV